MSAADSQALRRREAEFRSAVNPLPGSVPYVNRRPMNVQARFDGRSLGDYLAQVHAHRPPEHWRAACEAGGLSIDGREVRSLDQLVRGGNRIEHVVADTTEPTVSSALRFLYEDEHMVVLDKPAPLPMHPCGRYNKNSLVALLHHAFDEFELRPVHRLDADTTGVVVLAKTSDAARALARQFEARSLEKLYLARVEGHPPWEHKCVRASFSLGPSNAGRRELIDEGLDARSDFRVLRRVADQCLLEVRPRSGRTNQIRLQLASLGLPIVGDRPYGKQGDILANAGAALSGEGELCLHAWRLTFAHPQSGEVCVFEAPAPPWATDAHALGA